MNNSKLKKLYIKMREVGVIDVDIVNKCLLQNVISLRGFSTVLNTLDYNRKDLEELFKYLDYINVSNIDLEDFYLCEFIDSIIKDWDKMIRWAWGYMDKDKLFEFIMFLYYYDTDRYKIMIEMLRGNDGFIEKIEYNIREESLNKILN